MESIAVLDQDIKSGFSNKESASVYFGISRRHMILCGEGDLCD